MCACVCAEARNFRPFLLGPDMMKLCAAALVMMVTPIRSFVPAKPNHLRLGAHSPRQPRLEQPVALLLPDSAADGIARSLGYLVGAGSLLLYTPIAVRIIRQGNADGLTVSTWWLKVAAYASSDVYCLSKGYPISQFVETLIVTVEATLLLVIVSYYQRRLDFKFAALALGLLATAKWALDDAPAEALAVGQALATFLNTAALLPQISLNAQRGDAGDFSPVTAALACAGCAIRLFTTMRLADGDALLLGGFGLGLLLNGALLFQALYYGTRSGSSVAAVLASDFVGDSRTAGAVTPSADSDEPAEKECINRSL